MANISWCESPNALDCLADGEWDLMVEYIKHSAVIDFTIYDTEGTCVDTGQAFKFSRDGVLSQMYGGADTGDDLVLFANSTDAYPYIQLDGTDDIRLHTSADIEFYSSAELSFKFLNAGDTSTISGSDDTGDVLKLLANSTDTYPFIQLEGDDYIELDTTNYIYFKEQGEQTFLFDHTSPTSYMYGSDDAGDDLIILANSSDDCSSISLFGDVGIKFEIKATSVFEVATCSDEILFEIDSSAGDHHMDFHCLEADNFVLENRTDDPGSPCTGQIWFRTNLV